MYNPASFDVKIPEPFFSALAEGYPSRAIDERVSSATALFGRALSRLAVGLEREARADLEAALPELGDACQLELVFLDLRLRSGTEASLFRAREIAGRAPAKSWLGARAWHIAGLAEGRLRNTPAAVELLLKARELYRGLQDRWGGAAVMDTLGMLETARGRHDFAAQYFAFSVVEKALLGDRSGLAITLGNLGRLHMRAGRFHDAIDCFQRDLEIALELEDARGIGRMHNDLACAYMASQDLIHAEKELAECLDHADRFGFNDLQFYARKDLVLLRIRQRRLAEAERQLDYLESTLPENAEPYLRMLLNYAKAELLDARSDPGAIDVLVEVVEAFRAASLPDLEVPAIIVLARAYMQRKDQTRAEVVLKRGLQLAHQDGYGRYLPELKTSMAQVQVIAGSRTVTARVEWEPSADLRSYHVREPLGKGGFGEVDRAYDPERNQDVAIKRLRLNSLYDDKRRRRILQTMRAEYEAASRVNHPGIARVLAIGQQVEGDAYVIQEYIPGPTLRSCLPCDNSASLTQVLPCLDRIAHALQSLHHAGIVHRDLKPDNVILRHGRSPVLIDFGLAYMPDREVLDGSFIGGTLEYMAPEQAQGDRVTGQADLYALGVLAFEWLGGTRPLRFSDKNYIQAVSELCSRKPPSLTEFRPDLPKELVELVAALLEKQPRRRKMLCGDAYEVARRLHNFCQFIPSEVSSTVNYDSLGPDNRRNSSLSE